jgi:methylmalonyl-CoA/ethylmalonyl-CoA epimerase
LDFDHIGIFVKDIAEGGERLSALLPIARRSEVFEDPLIKVRVQFLYDSRGICYELVAPFGEGNPVDGVLKSGKNVLNHVAYQVENLEAAVAQLSEDGALALGPPCPAVAFGGARVVFLFTPLKFILELIENRQG